MKYLLSIIAVIFILSCTPRKQLSEQETSTTTEQDTKVDSQLIGKWTLEYMSPVAGKDVNQLYKMQMPYLTFVDEVKVAGNNGCNNVAGEYSTEGNRIHFMTEKSLSTRMFCENVDESAFLNALKAINGYSVISNGEKLMLLSGDIVAMSFVRTE